MSLWHWLMDRWQGKRRLDQLVEEFASVCTRELQRTLRDQVRNMSYYEGRGYVRTRAYAVVQRATRNVARVDGVAQHRVEELRDRVLDATVRELYRQLGSRPRTRISKAA